MVQANGKRRTRVRLSTAVGGRDALAVEQLDAEVPGVVDALARLEGDVDGDVLGRDGDNVLDSVALEDELSGLVLQRGG